MMNQLYLSNAVKDESQQNELSLLRLYAILDMQYMGHIPSEHVSDLLSYEQTNDTFNPYKLRSKVNSAFSNMFHGFASKSPNLSLLYGEIDPLTLSRNEGLMPSRPSVNPSSEEALHPERYPPFVLPDEPACDITAPTDIPLQLLAALAFLHELTDADFLGLLRHTPLSPILPPLATGLARRGHFHLLAYVMARHTALAPDAELPWAAVDALGQTALLAAAQRGHCALLWLLSGAAGADVAQMFAEPDAVVEAEADVKEAPAAAEVDAPAAAAESEDGTAASAEEAAPTTASTEAAEHTDAPADTEVQADAPPEPTPAPAAAEAEAQPASPTLLRIWTSASLLAQRFADSHPAFAPHAVTIAPAYLRQWHQLLKPAPGHTNTADAAVAASDAGMVPQRLCPGRAPRMVLPIDVADDQGAPALLHAVWAQHGPAAAFLIQELGADFRLVSHGALNAEVVLAHCAAGVRGAVEDAKAVRMTRMVGRRMREALEGEFKVDFPFAV